jgi:hypothetical protein
VGARCVSSARRDLCGGQGEILVPTATARSAASKCYRVVALKRARLKEVRPGNETAFGVLKELARTRRRNADKVDPGIGRTRLGQRTLKCVFLIGTRSAQSIMASGFTAAQTGRTHDRTRPMLQLCKKVLAKVPSTHDPKRTSVGPQSNLTHFLRRDNSDSDNYALSEARYGEMHPLCHRKRDIQ